ncbi:MAG: LysM peptidoglycan-binding domain-containing protein [Prochlorococcus sp.]
MRRIIVTALALTALLPLPAWAESITVKPGDTLSEIAARYQVSLRALMRVNGLSNSNLVVAGTTLQLPGTGTGSSSSSAYSGSGRHTVRSGETLSTIAARYKVRQRDLVALNNLPNANDLYIGQSLKLPSGAGSGITSSASRHTVASGETLSTIAARYKVRQQDLVALNGLPNANNLYIGQSLKLPQGAVIPQPRAAAKPKAVAIKANPNASSHTVARGQTLTQIAQAYGVSVASLININRIANPNKLLVGTKLTLRAKPSTENNPKTTSEVVVNTTTKPTVQTTAQTADKPSAKPETKPKNTTEVAANSTTKPTVQTTAQTADKPSAKPETKPKNTTEVAANSTTKPTVQTTAQTADKPAAKTEAKPKNTSEVAVNTTKTDWRTYGPLQVDWANWQLMEGSYVAKTLNKKGRGLYLAINCPARKINITGANGSWKTWSAPQQRFERNLVKDLCKAKGG